jgi:MerR family transcriptional regulator, copper efflux regulator
MSKADTLGMGPRYSIGETARAAGLTTKTIRYYEEIGLIPKARRRPGGLHTGGGRMYSDSDIGRLRFIRHARLVDLGLVDISELLKIADSGNCPSEHPVYSEVLKRHIRTIDERINHLLGLRSQVHELLKRNSSTPSACCTWETCGCMQSAPHGERTSTPSSQTSPGDRNV